MTKANLAYCLGLITKEDRNNVDLIAKVRNRFAHRIEGVSFEDQDIQDYCDELSNILFRAEIDQFNHLKPVAKGGIRHRDRSRGRFNLTSSILCTRLTLAGLSAKKCIAAKETPTTVVTDDEGAIPQAGLLDDSTRDQETEFT